MGKSHTCVAGYYMHCNMEPLKVASTALRYIDPISGAFFELALCRMVSANASFRIRLRGNLIARILMLVDNRQVNTSNM